MSLVYRWTVPASASGQAYVINSSPGQTVASGVVGVPDSTGGVVVRATLDEGTYTLEGVRAAWPGSSNPVGEVDIPASLAAASGGGGDFRTTDVANLVALNVAGLTDGSDVHAVLVADDRYGDLPDWCIDAGGGNFSFDADAGSLTIVGLDVCTIDFSGTTPAATPGIAYCSVTVKKDGNQITTGNKEQPGDGTNTQVVRAIATDQFGGGVMSIWVASTASDDEVAPIADGVTSHDIYIKLTREAYGPVEIA